MDYAKGGYIGLSNLPDGSVPFLLNRGCVLMSWSSYKAVGGRKGLDALGLLKDTDIELVLSTADVKELGGEALEKLRAELDTTPTDQVGSE